MESNDIYKFLQNEYPENVGKYIISKSLLRNPPELGKTFAENMNLYVNNIPTENSLITYGLSNDNIQTALNFLIKVIENEKNKENQFIQYLMKETKLTPPSTSEDWKTFVKTFQEKLSYGQLRITQLENELERLKINTEAKIEKKQTKDKQDKEKETRIRKVRDALEYTKEKLESVIKFLSGDNRSEAGREIIKFIIDNYGSSLFNITSNRDSIDFELNPSQTTALLIGISQILIETFYTKKLKDFYTELTKNSEASFSSAITNSFATEMTKILNDDKDLKKQIENLIERVRELPFLADDLIKNYKIPELKPISKQQLQQDANDEQIISKVNEISYRALNILRQNKLEPTINFIKNPSNISELSTGLRQMVVGSIANINTGKAQAKSDNIIGYISIEPQKITSDNRETVNDLIRQINKEINSLTEGLSQKNTLDYYTQRKNDWDITTKRIQDLLNQLTKIYGELVDCFLIEESTKAYYYLYTPGNRRDFEGGSLGANIVDQINKISALQSGNLISPEQADWLVTAAINAGPNLIGSDNKTKLENYLSMFATILLFDDQQNIANEVAENIITNIPTTQTGVKKIHLFTLNNGYYPLSFVLQLTFDKLYTIYNFLQNEIEHKTYSNGTGGSKVVLKGFINPDKYYPPNIPNNIKITSWDELSEKAINKLTMEVYFLTNAMDVISTILKSN